MIVWNNDEFNAPELNIVRDAQILAVHLANNNVPWNMLDDLDKLAVVITKLANKLDWVTPVPIDGIKWADLGYWEEIE